MSPPPPARLLALLLPAFELVLATGLVFSTTRMLPLIMAATAGLIILFTAWMIWVYRRGLHVVCGCFGRTNTTISSHTILRNIGFLTVALAGLTFSLSGSSALPIFADTPTIFNINMLVLGGSLILIFTLQLWRKNATSAIPVGASNNRSVHIQHRRHFIRQMGVGIIGGLALFNIAPMPRTYAANPSDSQSSLSLSAEEERLFTQLALTSDAYQKLKTLMGQKYPQLALQPERIRTGALPQIQNHVDLVGVSVPISGGTGYSFYNILFERASHKIVTSISGVFQFDKQNNVVTSVSVNGKLRLEAVLLQTGEVVTGVVYDDTGQSTRIDGLNPLNPSQPRGGHGLNAPLRRPTADPASWANCMNNCFSSMGIPAAAIAVAEIVCSIVTFGVGALPCLYAALFGWSFLVGWCAGGCEPFA